MKNPFNKILKHALKNNYAVGAFNFYNLETLQAILESAEENKSPVILQASTSAIKYMGEVYLKHLIKAVKEKAKVPVCFHLDHGNNLDACIKAIEIGFDSVMIDLSGLPLLENIKGTKEVVLAAKAKNVCVEGELGTLSGIEDEVNVKNSLFTNPLDVKKFVKVTGIDALAVAIGTSHGAYKFSNNNELNYKVLSSIEKEIPGTPLVLHGASSINKTQIDKINKYGGSIANASGNSNETLVKISKTHICKINTDSDLRLSFTGGVLEYLSNNKQEFDPRKYLGKAKEEVKAQVTEKIKLFGSANKASLIK